MVPPGRPDAQAQGQKKALKLRAFVIITALLASIALGVLGLWAAQAGALRWVQVAVVLLALACLGLCLAIYRLNAAAAAGEHLARSNAELSELATHLLQLAELEKSEVARNLHDELGGLLTAAKMDLSWMQGRVLEPALIQQRLHQLGGVLDEAMDVKRRVVEELRPSLLEHFGLQTALKTYLENACRQAGLECDVAMAGDEEMPREQAIALFRVVEEALDNVIRHARARSVHIKLAYEEQRYLLELIDDGVGMDLSSESFHWKHGLASMRQRVQALGGQLTLDSAPGRGLAVRIEVGRPLASASS
jgi:signal transduction histidine kinase